LISCDPWETYPPEDKYGQNEYDGDLTWKEISSSNSWVARYKHASTVFDGKLWILGGYGYQGVNKDSYLEDVWYSEDGENWECATMNAPWKGRTGHSVVTLNDKMILIGGYAVDEDGESTHETNHYMNDVWESDDGQEWEKIADNVFEGRAYHSATVIDGDIYVIGGRKDGTKYFDDIWKSEDGGGSWSEVTSVDNAILGERSGMAVASHDSKIYIQGGYTADYELAEVNQNDWKKLRLFDPANSTITRMKYPGSPYNNRALMKMVDYNDYLYLFSGVEIRREYNMDNEGAYSTWKYDYSNNLWSLDSKGSGFGPRHGYAAEVFDNKIWILGGWSYTGVENDVWTAEVED
jgi:N-acetylneuraminic acid mutarotase